MDNQALTTLVRQAMAQLHLTGLILASLVEKGILNSEQAQLLVLDARSKLDEGNMFADVFDLLKDELR